MRKIYLDYNATTPIDPEAHKAMLPFLREGFGNPSSLHWAGREARKALEEAREQIASALSCRPEEVIFTSGGTESINLAIKGAVSFQVIQKGVRPVHLITTQVEHQAVLKSVEDLERLGLAEVTRLGVDHHGNIDLEELEAAICPQTVLISIMFANNETGNLSPIVAIGRLAREKGILFHSDAVQVVGKVPIKLSELPVDLLSFSSHKIYGPKGVGALYLRRGVKMSPLISGGAQEMERRGGTENLPAIVGFATAMTKAHQDLEAESRRQGRLRDFLEEQLLKRVSGTMIHGDCSHRVCNTLSVSFKGVTSETLLIALDREGIAVSSGSACASGAVEPSHVLMAMGVDRHEAKGAIRFSLGRGTIQTEIEYLLEKIPEIVGAVRES